jgi:mono/diheme cytochrome c family protein
MIKTMALCLAIGLTTTTHVLAQSPSYPQIERGRYLAAVGDCTACHTTPGAPAFSGGLGLDTPFGTIYSSNITPDLTTGIGKWTPDDFWRALHEGHRPDGSQIYPAMPYSWTTRTTREDSDALFAYLQTVPAVDRAKPDNDLYPPLNLRISVAGWNLLFFSPETFKPDPKKSDAWNRGAYIVTGLGHCGGCHTKLNEFGAAENSQALRGNALNGWYAPDLTNSPTSGLGNWTDDDIVAYLHTGRNAKAIAAGPMADVVMHSTQFMTPSDLQAIATYLRSIPGAPAEQPAKVEPKISKAGSAIYRDNCAACHGAAGLGAAELIPSLVGNGAVVGTDPTTILHVILQGAVANHTSSAPTNPGMPAFDWKLSDAEVAAVATYLRTSWGNRASIVEPGSVGKMRKQVRDARAN